jgi:hypothetical protein
MSAVPQWLSRYDKSKILTDPLESISAGSDFGLEDGVKDGREVGDTVTDGLGSGVAVGVAVTVCASP